MVRRRLHRLVTTFSVVVSLLFSQLALARYVCPGQSNAVAMAEMVAAGQPCDGMDEAQPTLCHQHSASASQSFEAVKLPVAALPVLVQVRVVPPALGTQDAAVQPFAATPAARPPPGPLFLSTLRLRV